MTSQDKKVSQLPRFSLLNARSLFSKVNELSAFLYVNSIEISVIIETWYHNEINDDLTFTEGFTVHRRDRVYGHGGWGLCICLECHLQ